MQEPVVTYFRRPPPPFRLSLVTSEERYGKHVRDFVGAMSEIGTSQVKRVTGYWDVKIRVSAKLELLAVKITILCHKIPGKTEGNYEGPPNNLFTQAYIRIYYYKRTSTKPYRLSTGNC
jgi:hypothetical protein